MVVEPDAERQSLGDAEARASSRSAGVRARFQQALIGGPWWLKAPALLLVAALIVGAKVAAYFGFHWITHHHVLP